MISHVHLHESDALVASNSIPIGHWPTSSNIPHYDNVYLVLQVTFVENLEIYGIDPAMLAHDVQIGMQCSASVAPHPAKKQGQGMQVTIQGNQINYIAQLLTGMGTSWGQVY